MSDETTNAGADAAAPQTPPEVRIVTHYIRDLSFENVAAQEGKVSTGTPEINVTVNMDAGSVGENRYQIGMKINAAAKTPETTRFVVELDYVGVFDIMHVPQEHIHPFLFIECPRQILPYARRVISDVTRDGGYPPLMLDNVDFAQLYRAKLAELQAKQEAGGGGNGAETPPVA
ncbi:MAG: protein-export chaperone SecB [Pseudomonadota bacterium]